MQTKTTTSPNETSPLADAPAPLPGSVFLLRTCRACGAEKPLRAYYKQRGCADRYRLDCIECLAERSRRRRSRERLETPPETRRCGKCRRTQPIAEFAKDARCRAGHSHVCIRCVEQPRAKREQRRQGLNLPDKLLTARSALRQQRIDLGIAIAHATCPPGECRSLEEIAAYSGLTVEAVRRIEARALWKMQARARRVLSEAGLEHLIKEEKPR